MSKDWKTRTQLVHQGSRRSQYGEMAEAIFLTQGFTYDSAENAEARFLVPQDDEFVYARYGNPTTRMFEERIATVEGCEDAFATASGMAAVSGALMAMLKAGDHVVAARALFGSCLYVLENILQRYGVLVDFVDGTDLSAWERAITANTKAVFFETMSNPTLEVIDIKEVACLAHAKGALVLVDNVFSTPIFSRAVDLGADVIIYSTTKHIDGQGRALGGVICGTKAFIRGVVEPYLKHTGGAMSPFTSWIMLNGMVTLDLRCRAMATSALEIALSLQGDARLSKVIYPGLDTHPQAALVALQMGSGGTMISFELAGGKEAAFTFMNGLKIIKISNNLGDAKSIATHPATTTHSRLPQDQKDLLGISYGLIRLSVGLEDPLDLIDDIKSGLNLI